MIARISSGKSTAGLIRYLFDTKKAKDHTDPHLVASWDGFAPDPGRAEDFDATKKLLVADLDLRVKQARRLGRAPEQHVWHCSVRAAPEDRELTDDEWAQVARRIVHATGIAPEGDPDGCHWVAVRHAPDHIHIAATKVRGDLSSVRHWHDYRNADRELVAVEKEYGLRQVARGDRTAAKRPTRAEQEKSRRRGRGTTAREQLRTTVRTAVAAASTIEEFAHLLSQIDGVITQVVYFPSGDVRGYKIALKGDTNAQGDPVWFSGSELAPDLSFPKIRERLNAIEPATDQQLNRGRPDPWHQTITMIELIPHHLDQADDEASQAHLHAFGEVLDALPLLAPRQLRTQLRDAATAFERATRSRIRAEQHQARALRSAARAMLRQPPPKDGALLAMLLDAAVLVVIAASRWHQRHHHDQQVEAARQALLHLQIAYDQAAVAPLAALAQGRPSQQIVERHIHHVRRAVPSQAERVLADPAFDALITVLSDSEAAGHDPDQLLRQATDQRPLDDARNPARVLTWRVQRITTGQALSSRDRVAGVRSTVKLRTSAPAHSAEFTPSQPSAPGRRR
ncbi:relaxase/mobilization nuclease domain-containing protein [Streptomyces uncialis]|uniref:Mobilization protein n=1 Tax=Streptomyces uncialis TaxID=1048205 RepID=A0A1Q4UXY0_9ACTN|nr:mobilization protein [Streptomyces uncialis]OKH90421.1 mobilization protein [Streptomyces uncialis]